MSYKLCSLAALEKKSLSFLESIVYISLYIIIFLNIMDTHTYIYVFYICCCLVTELSDSFATPWTVASLALLSMEFPRQEHWSRLPFPSPGDLPDPGIEPASTRVSALQADPFLLSHQRSSWYNLLV